MYPGATGNIIPVAEPWPYTTDGNGQSYPGGLVGVRMSYDPNHDPPATYNNGLLIAVPSALPAGYTFRGNRDHNVTTPTSSAVGSNSCLFAPSGSAFTPSTVTAPGWQLRDATHAYDYGWLPENQGNAAFGPMDGGSGSLGSSVTLGNSSAAPVGWFSSACAGIRYLRYQAPTYGDPYRIDLVTNTDGSQTQPGNTVIWTANVPGNDPLGGQLSHYYDSGYVTLNWYPSSHTKVWIGFRIYDTYVNSYTYVTGVYLRMGGALNVPFPFTCYGLDAGGGHIVAPGGI